MKLHLKKLTSAGIAHHALIAIVVVMGFASLGAYRVFQSSADTAWNMVNAEGCFPGEKKKPAAPNKGTCIPMGQVANIQTDCAVYHLRYADGVCKKDCVGEYTNIGGFCKIAVVQPPTPPPTPTPNPTPTPPPTNNNCPVNGQIKEDGYCFSAQKRDECNAKHRKFSRENNTCTENCWDAWERDNNSSPCYNKQDRNKCLAENRQFNKTNNTCEVKCQAGWHLTNGTSLPCVVVANPPTPTPTTGGGCPAGTALDEGHCVDWKKRNDCEAAHRKFTKATNTCEDNCAAGWYKKDGKLPCVQLNNPPTPGSTTPTPKADVKCTKADGTKVDPKADGTCPANADKTCAQGYKLNAAKTDCIKIATTPSTVPTEVCIKNGHTVSRGSDGKCPANSNDKCPDNTFLVDNKCISATPVCKDDGKIVEAKKNGDCPKGADLKCAQGLTLKDDECVKSSVRCEQNGKVTAADASGNCPANTALVCPRAAAASGSTCITVPVVQPQTTPAASAAVTVDTTISEGDCILLGREWIKAKNTQPKGCSTQTCNISKDGSPTFNNGQSSSALFCRSAKFDNKAYAAIMSKKDCDELHRKSTKIGSIELCFQNPNQKKENDTIIKADQCKDNFSTYYIRASQEDECFSPSFFERAQGVGSVLSAPIGAVLEFGPAKFCGLRSGYHWDGHANACKKDRAPAPVAPAKGADGSSTQPEPIASGSTAPNGTTWAVFCASLGRSTAGNSCTEKCTDPNKARNPGRGSYGYDNCDVKSVVCGQYHTGGTRNCPMSTSTNIPSTPIPCTTDCVGPTMPPQSTDKRVTIDCSAFIRQEPSADIECRGGLWCDLFMADPDLKEKFITKDIDMPSGKYRVTEICTREF